MSKLLEKAVAELFKLPDAEQEAFAAMIFDELEDDQHWEQSFARSTDKLRTLADRAVEQVKAGECRTAGFDKL